MIILDNFLPPSLHEIIKSELTSEFFPWYFNDSIAYENSSGNNFQFTHTFYADQTPKSNWFGTVQAMIFVLESKLNVKLKGILRIKANLNPQNPLLDPLENVHQDCTGNNFMTLLYYVNDSDGDTLIFDDDRKTIVDRITPQENKAIWFDSKIWHTSSPPIKNKNKRRIVINFILEVEDESRLD